MTNFAGLHFDTRSCREKEIGEDWREQGLDAPGAAYVSANVVALQVLKYTCRVALRPALHLANLPAA